MDQDKLKGLAQQIRRVSLTMPEEEAVPWIVGALESVQWEARNEPTTFVRLEDRNRK